MSFRKTGIVTGIALLLAGTVSAGAAEANPNLGLSPRDTQSYVVYPAPAPGIDYRSTGSISTGSSTSASGATADAGNCLGSSPRQTPVYSCPR